MITHLTLLVSIPLILTNQTLNGATVNKLCLLETLGHSVQHQLRNSQRTERALTCAQNTEPYSRQRPDNTKQRAHRKLNGKRATMLSCIKLRRRSESPEGVCGHCGLVFVKSNLGQVQKITKTLNKKKKNNRKKTQLKKLKLKHTTNWKTASTAV